MKLIYVVILVEVFEKKAPRFVCGKLSTFKYRAIFIYKVPFVYRIKCCYRTFVSEKATR